MCEVHVVFFFLLFVKFFQVYRTFLVTAKSVVFKFSDRIRSIDSLGESKFLQCENIIFAGHKIK